MNDTEVPSISAIMLFCAINTGSAPPTCSNNIPRVSTRIIRRGVDGDTHRCCGIAKIQAPPVFVGVGSNACCYRFGSRHSARCLRYCRNTEPPISLPTPTLLSYRTIRQLHRRCPYAVCVYIQIASSRHNDFGCSSPVSPDSATVGGCVNKDNVPIGVDSRPINITVRVSPSASFTSVATVNGDNKLSSPTIETVVATVKAGGVRSALYQNAMCIHPSGNR